MNALPLRPPVGDVTLLVYDRPLHPEFFDTLAVHTVRRGDYELTVRVTPAGHALVWRTPGVALTELTAAAGELPAAGRLLRQRMRCPSDGALRRAGVSYQVSSQVERLPPEVFRHEHDALVTTGGKYGLFHHFGPHHRLSLVPLTAVSVDATADYVAVSAFHTFPEEHAILKTQTLIEPT